MKTLIFILVIIAFIQTAVLPLDLILLILICRGYIKTEEKNLYLAFGFGILIAHLEVLPLGLVSIVYLTLVQLTQMLSKFSLAGHFLLIVPLTFVLLSLNQITTSLLIHQTPELFPKVIIESFLSLPVLFLVKLWEERFIVKHEIKLKL